MGSTEAPLRLRRVLSATRLLLRVQRRAGFVAIYAAVTALTVLVIRFALPEAWRAWAAPCVLLGEFGTMGLFLTAAHRYLERIEGSHVALVVTPLGLVEHVAATVAAPAIVATVAGAALFVAVLGLDGRALLVVPPLALSAWLAGALGLVLAARCSEFTRFLVASIPVVTVTSLPFLSFFGFTPRWSFAWLPWDAALFAYADLARHEVSAPSFLLQLVQLGAFAALAFAWAVRCHRLERPHLGEAA